jgi:GTPase Era involved in 16S rRNA processing
MTETTVSTSLHHNINESFVVVSGDESQKKENPRALEINKTVQSVQAAAVQVIQQRPVIQMISKEAEYIDSVATELERWDFLNKGFDYYVVAILGCQSSGKSTLLNRLFGTQFEVMDPRFGRNQTTKGVWLGLSETKHYSILVLDVEGTDSRERGEEHGSFERKTSLFSLALSEVLIINLWVHDIGRYDGANYGLLKIVFELNLQLFQSSNTGKTLLFFVFRDHAESETPLELLIDAIRKDMDTIWKGIAKPDKYKTSQISDFFEFAFASLPHKILLPEKFELKCTQLRDRFLNAENPDNVLQRCHRKDIPADGFYKYTKEIWNTIKMNKDLDLPTQKEMLAIYRCEEILNESYAEFTKKIFVLKSPLTEGQLIEHFSDSANKLVDDILEHYDSQAKRYHEEVRKKKRSHLLEKLNADLFAIFQQQMKFVIAQVQKKCEKLLKKELPENKSCRNFVEIAEKIRRECLEYYMQQFKNTYIERFEWKFVDEQREMEKWISTRLDAARETQISLLQKDVNKFLERSLSIQISKIIERSEHKELWRQIRDAFAAAMSTAHEKLEDFLKSLQSSSDEIQQKKEELKNASHTIVYNIMKEKANNIVYLMERKFNSTFKLDEHGVPRNWKPQDDIKTIYMNAKKEAEKLLDLLSIVRLQEDDESLTMFRQTESGIEALEKQPDVPEAIVVIPLEQALQHLERFRDQSQGSYLQALREQEHASTQKSIPLYFIILLMILGFDEFVYVLKNPFLFIIIVLLGLVGYLVYVLNLWPIFRPIVKPVTDVLMNVTLSASKKWLESHLNGGSNIQTRTQETSRSLENTSNDKPNNRNNGKSKKE